MAYNIKHLLNFDGVEHMLTNFIQIKKDILKLEYKYLDKVDRCLASLMAMGKERRNKLLGIKITPRCCDKGMVKEFGSFSPPFSDHLRKFVFEKKLWFLSSNYSLNLEMLKDIIKSCEENNIDFRIDGNSSYFPGRTIRMLFWKISEVDNGG